MDSNYIPASPNDLSNVLLKHQHRWPMIAHDIALMMQPDAGATTFDLEGLSCAYGMTKEEMSRLVSLPSFMSLLKAELKRAKDLGPNAGHKMRSAAIATDLLEILYLKAKSGDLTDNLVFRLLETCSKAAGIDGSLDKKDSGSQTSVNILVNIPHLSNPKLRHLEECQNVQVINEPNS